MGAAMNYAAIVGDTIMPRKILRPAEAQARLGVKHTRFYDLVNAGKIRLIRLGPRSTGVIEDELDAYIESLPNARESALTSE
jgi:excisionase family DNA binding protein